MKKIFLLGIVAFMTISLTSCKSSQESAYQKAWQKAKQQEMAQTQPVEDAPIVAAPVVAVPVAPAPAAPVEVGTIREEKVQLVSGEGLKAYSVVCGFYTLKVGAEAIKAQLDADGYNAMVVFSPDANNGQGGFRVIVASFDDRMQAAQARDDFKAKYPNKPDFQKSWLLYAK